jgi:Cu(I)/Ag(I) efflux system membrane fusion protein
MNVSVVKSWGVALAVSVALALGCGGDSSTSKPATPPAKPDTKAEPKAEPKGQTQAPAHDHDAVAEEDGDAAKIKAAFAKLSAEDRVVAEAQKTCPVSNEALGSMGTPFKVSYRGQSVFLCCDGCESDFNKEPEKFITTAKPEEAAEGSQG